MSRDGCISCRGNGKCAECEGTGVNIHLNESEPKCRACSGTGVCSACKGSGRANVRPPEMIDPGFDKL